MAELSRKLVPVQKASIAVPWRSLAMIYSGFVSFESILSQKTNRQRDRDGCAIQ